MAPPELVQTDVKPAGLGPKPASLPGRAYVTFLAGNGDYVKGVVGLAKGLRKVKTAYPLVVAVLPDVPEEHRNILESQGCIVREIEPVYPPDNQTQYAMAYYVINYSKLRIWEVRTFFWYSYNVPTVLASETCTWIRFECFEKSFFIYFVEYAPVCVSRSVN